MKQAGTVLDERAAEWRQLPRRTPEEREAADACYQGEVLPLLRASFVAAERVHLPHRYAGLIVAVGADATPAILSLATVEPERVQLVYAAGNEPSAEAVLAATGRPQEPFARTAVLDQPILEAYAAVRDVHRSWGGLQPIAVDITGGPASLSAGMAMAAYAVGADLVAVESDDWWPEVGRPRPGSEHLTFPPHPYAAFGDLTREQALRAYARHDLGLAEDLFALLAASVDSSLYGPYRDLAAAYRAWDAFDAGRAAPAMQAALEALEADPGHPLSAHRRRLRDQAAVLVRLRPLSGEEEPPATQILTDPQRVADLAYSVYHAARRAAQAGRASLSILLHYRLLELLVQRRLARRGLDTFAPDYASLQEPDLAGTLGSLRRELLQQEPEEEDGEPELPRQIGLGTGFLLLQALGDPLTDAVDWTLLRECLAARNRSILVHGYLWPGQVQVQAFGRLLNPVFARFCEVEDLDRYVAPGSYRFIEL